MNKKSIFFIICIGCACIVSGCRKNDLKDIQFNSTADPEVNQPLFVIDSINTSTYYGLHVSFYFHITNPQVEVSMQNYNIYKDGLLYATMAPNHPKWVVDFYVNSGSQPGYQIGAKDIQGFDSKKSNTVSIKIP